MIDSLAIFTFIQNGFSFGQQYGLCRVQKRWIYVCCKKGIKTRNFFSTALGGGLLKDPSPVFVLYTVRLLLFLPEADFSYRNSSAKRLLR